MSDLDEKTLASVLTEFGPPDEFNHYSLDHGNIALLISRYLAAAQGEDMVERVAAVLRKAHITIDVSNYGLSASAELTDPEDVARAAIAAMQEREP